MTPAWDENALIILYYSLYKFLHLLLLKVLNVHKKQVTWSEKTK